MKAGAGAKQAIVRGNHDAEFHWPAVQAEFKSQLSARLGLSGGPRRRVEQRIQFHPWFYLEPGFFYAEHGNAHDRYSVQSGFFDPAGVSHELDLPLSSKVLRYFANRYAEQTDLDEVDTWGVPEYIDWVLKAGNPLRIAADYFVMVWRVTYPVFVQSLKAWRRFARAADKAISQVDAHASSAHLRKALGRFSGTEAQARQLLAIASRPAEESLFDSMQLFYLDRAVLAVGPGFRASPALQRGARPVGEDRRRRGHGHLVRRRQCGALAAAQDRLPSHAAAGRPPDRSALRRQVRGHGAQPPRGRRADRQWRALPEPRFLDQRARRVPARGDRGGPRRAPVLEERPASGGTRGAAPRASSASDSCLTPGAGWGSFRSMANRRGFEAASRPGSS